MHIGERIKLARMEAGLNQADLAEILGVEPPTVSRWENNLIQPRARSLAEIAKALNKPPEWFLGTVSPIDQMAAMERRLRDLEDATKGFSADLTAKEKRLLTLFRSVTDTFANTLLSVVEEAVRDHNAKASGRGHG